MPSLPIQECSDVPKEAVARGHLCLCYPQPQMEAQELLRQLSYMQHAWPSPVCPEPICTLHTLRTVSNLDRQGVLAEREGAHGWGSKMTIFFLLSTSRTLQTSHSICIINGSYHLLKLLVLNKLYSIFAEEDIEVQRRTNHPTGR